MKKNKEKKEKPIKKRIPSRKIFYYVCAIGVLVTIIFYLFPFRYYVSMTEELEKENNLLAKKIKIWKGYDEKKEELIAEKDMMRQNISDTCKKYPADVKEEDIVMTAVKLQEEVGVAIKNINISEPQIIYTIDEASALALGIEELAGELNWWELKASYVVEGDYETIKDTVKHIYNENNKKGVYSITLTKSDAEDKKNMLIGNVDVSFYSLQGTTKEYSAPNISKYALGTDNIFGVEDEIETEVEGESEEEEAVASTTE